MVPNNLNAQYAEDFFKEKAKVIVIKINKKRDTRCKSSESFKKTGAFSYVCGTPKRNMRPWVFVVGCSRARRQSYKKLWSQTVFGCVFQQRLESVGVAAMEGRARAESLYEFLQIFRHPTLVTFSYANDMILWSIRFLSGHQCSCSDIFSHYQSQCFSKGRQC